jgi:hypothetical protein
VERREMSGGGWKRGKGSTATTELIEEENCAMLGMSRWGLGKVAWNCVEHGSSRRHGCRVAALASMAAAWKN